MSTEEQEEQRKLKARIRAKEWYDKNKELCRRRRLEHYYINKGIEPKEFSKIRNHWVENNDSET
jgi:hypothetical protein